MGLLLFELNFGESLPYTSYDRTFFLLLLVTLVGPSMDYVWIQTLSTFRRHDFLVTCLLRLCSPFSRMWELLPITREQYQYRQSTGKSFPSRHMEESRASYRFCSFRERIFCHYHDSISDFVAKEKQLVEDSSSLSSFANVPVRNPFQEMDYLHDYFRGLWVQYGSSVFIICNFLKDMAPKGDTRFQLSRAYEVIREYHHLVLFPPRFPITFERDQDTFLWGTVDLLCLSLAEYEADLDDLVVSFFCDPACYRDVYSMNGGSKWKYRYVDRKVLLSSVFTHAFLHSPDGLFLRFETNILKQAAWVAKEKFRVVASGEAEDRQLSRQFRVSRENLELFASCLLNKDRDRLVDLFMDLMSASSDRASLEILAHHDFFQLDLDVSRFPSFFSSFPPFSEFLTTYFQEGGDRHRSPDRIFTQLQHFTTQLQHSASKTRFVFELVPQVVSYIQTKPFGAHRETSRDATCLVQWKRLAPFMTETELVYFFRQYFDEHLREKGERPVALLFELMDAMFPEHFNPVPPLFPLLQSLHQALTVRGEEREKEWNLESIRVVFLLLFHLLKRDDDPFQAFVNAIFGGFLYHRSNDKDIREALDSIKGQEVAVRELMLWVPLYWGFPRDLLFLMEALGIPSLSSERTPPFLHDRLRVMKGLQSHLSDAGKRVEFWNTAPDIFLKAHVQENDVVHFQNPHHDASEVYERRNTFNDTWRNHFAVCAKDVDLFVRTLYHFQCLRYELIKKTKLRDSIFPFDETFLLSLAGRPSWEQELRQRASKEPHKPLSVVREENLISRSKTCPYRQAQPRLGETTVLCSNLHVLTVGMILGPQTTKRIMDKIKDAFSKLGGERELVYSLKNEFGKLQFSDLMDDAKCPLCNKNLPMKEMFFPFLFDPRYYGSANAGDISPWTEENSDPSKSPVELGTYERLEGSGHSAFIENKAPSMHGVHQKHKEHNEEERVSHSSTFRRLCSWMKEKLGGVPYTKGDEKKVPSAKNRWVMKRPHPSLPFKPDYPFVERISDKTDVFSKEQYGETDSPKRIDHAKTRK